MYLCEEVTFNNFRKHCLHPCLLADHPEMIPETERLKVELFTEYLRAQEDEGFVGTFDAFVRELNDGQLDDLLPPDMAEQVKALEKKVYPDGPPPEPQE